MTRDLNLPDIEKEQKHDRGAKGCAIVIMAWLICITILAAVVLTAGLARLAFWAVGL